MAAPGVQGGETFFKVIDLIREVRWRQRNIKLWVIGKLLLRDRDSGSNRSNMGGTDAEKKRIEDGTLWNTRGNMSRCRRVITNGDGLRVTSKIGFDPIVN
jgi:hypothetical protein